MKRLALLSGLLLLAGSCASPPDDEPPFGAPPPPLDAPAAEPAPAPSPPKDACGAAEVQHLVGRPRSEIPVPLEPSRQRVACTTCPITEDYRPDRLNFFFDAQTGLIKEIRCG